MPATVARAAAHGQAALFIGSLQLLLAGVAVARPPGLPFPARPPGRRGLGSGHYGLGRARWGAPRTRVGLRFEHVPGHAERPCSAGSTHGHPPAGPPVREPLMPRLFPLPPRCPARSAAAQVEDGEAAGPWPGPVARRAVGRAGRASTSRSGARQPRQTARWVSAGQLRQPRRPSEELREGRMDGRGCRAARPRTTRARSPGRPSVTNSVVHLLARQVHFRWDGGGADRVFEGTRPGHGRRGPPRRVVKEQHGHGFASAAPRGRTMSSPYVRWSASAPGGAHRRPCRARGNHVVLSGRRR